MFHSKAETKQSALKVYVTVQIALIFNDLGIVWFVIGFLLLNNSP